MMFGVSAVEFERAIQAVLTGHDPYVEPGCPYCGTAASRDGYGACASCGAPPVLARRGPERDTETIYADGFVYHTLYGPSER